MHIANDKYIRWKLTQHIAASAAARPEATNSRPVVATTYAKYIGRVGGLAVALGIGGALATPPAIAWADEPSATASSTSSEANQSSETTPTGANPPATVPTSTPSKDTTTTNSSASAGDTPKNDSESSSSETVATPGTGVVVRSSGGALTSGGGDTTKTTDEDPLGPGQDEQKVPAESEANPSADDPTPQPTSTTPPASRHEKNSSTTQVTPVTAGTSASASMTRAVKTESQPSAMRSPDTAVSKTTASNAVVDAQTFALADHNSATALTTLSNPVSSTPDPHPIATAIRTVVTTATQMFTDVVASVFGPTPAGSPQTPIAWALLGWVQQQIGAAFGYQPRSSDPTLTTEVEPTPTTEDPTIEALAEVDATDQSGLPEEFERTTLVSGLNQPTDFRFLPDGRILIAEKGGAIKVYHDGEVHDAPLITLAVLQTDNDEERGLLGIAPDPDFENNGYLYVSYTSQDNHDRLSRVTVVGDHADPATEVVLLESDQLGNVFHHGGDIEFGPDGKLYWAMGMNTYNPNSQDLSNVHGKILRLNPDGSVPEDNPFIDTPGAVPQIWAYGLRNPFRFTFTPDGQLLTGDVGGDQWEELDIVTAGANYGWPLAEGVCDGCGFANPIYTYHHTDPPAKAGSITGVMVYTGDTFGEEYKNKVFIADYTLGWIKELTFDSTYTSFISEKMFDDQAGTTVKLAQGPDGNIYQLNIFPGVLSVIAPSGGNRAPTAVITATPANGLAPLAINFSSQGSTDPDPSTTLTYAWDFGDGTTSTAANPSKTYTVNGPYDVNLTVSDGDKTNQATKRIVVGSTAPTVTITSPVNNSLYSAGDVVSFSATAFDAEDGVLPDSAYNWTVVFHHADHIHPFRDNIIGPSGSVTIPRSADNIDTTYYHITLTVTDSSGLSTSQSVDVKPRLVTLTFNSATPGAKYSIDGIPQTGTYTEHAVVGVERALSAPSPQFTDSGQLVFDHWSDGGAQTHTIITPATDASYTVYYDAVSGPPAPWHETDIGARTTLGSSEFDNGLYTIHGGGADIWDTTDEFHYIYQPLDGDGTVIARVTSQSATDPWSKSGIMIKQSATPNAPYVLLAVTPDHGTTFQYNFNGDGGSASYTFPNAWLKLERKGDVFTGYTSADGTQWTVVGQTTLAMGDAATAGLAVSAHALGVLNTTTMDNVSLTPAQEWRSQDVGAPQIVGSTTVSGGTFTVTGGGNDIWADADQFQFVHQTLTGDGEIIARVTSQTAADAWSKAGVMIKQNTTAGSPYALLAVTPGNGVHFQYDFSHDAAGPATAAPNTWLKLTRTGDTITSYTSTDGQTWNQVASATVDLADNAEIGLFVTSHNGAQPSTAIFDNVTVFREAIVSV
jgi:glucose/arabinose dehydrogenase/regulation of enolase protein 1 (concanavalin A-like superfamily)